MRRRLFAWLVLGASFSCGGGSARRDAGQGAGQADVGARDLHTSVTVDTTPPVSPGDARDTSALDARRAEDTRADVSQDATAGATVRVFLLAGQSNMVGNGGNSELPAELKGEQKAVRITAHHTFIHADGKIAPVTFEWGALRPGLGTAAGAFGPELTVGRDLARLFPGERLALIKCAWSGTNLHVDWRPPSAGGSVGARYSTCMRFFRDARQALGAAHELGGVLWMQGESDALAGDSKMADAYRSNLTAFIADVRAAMDSPALPFVLAKIGTGSGSGKYTDQVREAQDAVARAVPQVAIFDTKAYPLFPDGLHYTSSGYLQLGADFVKALRPLIGR